MTLAGEVAGFAATLWLPWGGSPGRDGSLCSCWLGRRAR